jgi:hypothetical protein
MNGAHHMALTIEFIKTGKEIKDAVQKRRHQLQERLDKRNLSLDEFLKESRKVRSYMVRQSQAANPGMHYRAGKILYSKDEISSEEMQEVYQLCQRILELEQELHRLQLLVVHLKDDQVFELSFDDLVSYGFDSSLSAE